MKTVQRSRRRRALYVIGVVPSLLMLLVALRIVLMLQDDSAGHEAYAASDFADSRGEFAANRILNPFERWIAPFNEGDARYQLEDHPEAVAAFEDALEVVPTEHECAVRINLALAHEAVGDTSLTAGDRQEAETAWEEGRTALAPCFAAGPSEAEKRTARRVDTRLLLKLGDRPSPIEPTDVTPEDARTRELERILEEQNQEARLERARKEGREGGANSGEVDIPHW